MSHTPPDSATASPAPAPPAVAAVPRAETLDGLELVGVILELRPTPPGPDIHGAMPIQRLRRLLKHALRTCGWRCTRHQPIVARRPAASPERAQTKESRP